jgi:hypothetical protein
MKINVLTIILGVVAIICIIVQVKSYKQSSYYSGIISAKEDSLKIWQDEAGRWRAEATTAQVSKKDLMVFFCAEKKQIQEDFNIKLKNVTGYLRANMETIGEVSVKADSGTQIVVCNSNGSDTAQFHYSDTWTNFDAKLFKNQLIIPYKTRDSIAFISSIKHLGFLGLGGTKAMLDGISYNPNSKISGITNIEVKVPAERVGIGPYLGYGFNGSKWSLSAGIAIHYSLVKF